MSQPKHGPIPTPAIDVPVLAIEAYTKVLTKWAPQVAIAATIQGRDPAVTARAFGEDLRELVIAAIREAGEVAEESTRQTMEDIRNG